ncbi:DUF2716 domain-containing protein [Microbacterium sp. NPDC076768]|uniref:DUF2716 domain-containing protein n=1 Tax=Microbacterium sp. NPDC076768 TaxID=3154858 RepID=UPI00343B5C00
MSLLPKPRPGWRAMSDEEKNHTWDRFYEKFDFRASPYASDWPSIIEPTPSVTFDLSAPSIGPDLPLAFAALNAEALRCFVWALPEISELSALDWQHTAWWFNPRLDDAPTQWDDLERSQPTVFPDGDYFAFLNTDMSEGTFGHPWEQTLCVMGDRLIDTLGKSLALWLPVLRVNGKPATDDDRDS